MGLCLDKDQITTEESKNIEKELAAIKLIQANVIKVLLLGTGESGKSTLMKQFKLKFSNTVDMEIFLDGFRDIIYNNILDTIKILVSNRLKLNSIKQLEAYDKIDLDVGSYHEMGSESNKSDLESNAPMGILGSKTVLDEVLIKIKDWEANKIRDEQSLISFMLEIRNRIAEIWRDESIKVLCMTDGNYTFHLSDGARYFLDNLDRIIQKDYMPNRQDILWARSKTTGIDEMTFVHKRWSFKVIDVGGQRSERRKWIHCFDNVNTLIYCVSIGDYNLKLREDEDTLNPENPTNYRLHDSMATFKQLLEIKELFKETTIIIFFNKVDLLEQRIKTHPFKKYMPSFSHENTSKGVLLYMTERFRLIVGKRPNDLYFHNTTAVDETSMSGILDTVRENIISKNMEKLGL